MARPGLTIEKLDGGLGRRSPNQDMVTAVVMNAVDTVDMIAGNIYTLRSLQDAELLGLSDQYDADNAVLVYHRLKRLFHHNPSIIVHFMPVGQAVTMAQMVDPALNYAAKLLRDKKGEVVQTMIARNPDELYEPTIEEGLDSDSIAAVSKAQELANSEFAKDRYCEFFIEGRSFTGTATAATDFRSLETDCPDVSLVIFADNDISTANAAYAGYAAVEDFTGLVSKAAVSQNAGELIPDFNLTDAFAGVFINAGLSSGNHINTYSDVDLDTLNAKGYIIATGTSGIFGYHILDTHTCTGLDSDYAYVENNRTIKKAIKLARLSVLPRVKGRLYVDENTGQMAPEEVKEIEAVTEAALNPMLADGDLSGGVDAYIDPAQNILATSKFEIKLTFVPVAIGRRISLKIGFNNPFKP